MYFMSRYILSFLIFMSIFTSGFCASLFSRGVVVGLPLGAMTKSGFLVEDIGVYFSEPNRVLGSTNTMGNVGVFEYTTETRWFDNRFRFIAAPVIEWKKGPEYGSSWHYGVPSPVFLGGLVHEIFPGLGFANYVGGSAPLRAGSAQRDVWLFLNMSSLSYTRDDYNITFTTIYGHPGPDLSDNVTKIFPNFINMDFTATKKLAGIEFGPIWYSSKDLNTSRNQQQLAIGGLVGMDVLGWHVQFWMGHDLYAYDYPQQTLTGYFRVKKYL